MTSLPISTFQSLQSAVKSGNQIELKAPASKAAVSFKETASKHFLGRVCSWIKSAITKRSENQETRAAVVKALAQTYALERDVGVHDVIDILSQIDTQSALPLRSRKVQQLIEQLEKRSVGSEFIDRNLQAPATKLGSGAINTVYLGTWQVANSPQAMVFKAEQTQSTPLQVEATVIGIDPDKPRMSERNLATSAVAQHLKLDVIPDTQRARYQGQIGTVMGKAEGTAMQHSGSMPVHLSMPDHLKMPSSQPDREKLFGTLQGIAQAHGMEIVTPTPGAIPKDGKFSIQVQDRAEKEKNIEAKLSNMKDMLLEDGELSKDNEAALREQKAALEGRTLTSYVQWNLEDPVLREKITDLQWLDCLCGQADRHTGNIVVDFDPSSGSVRGLKGIDNDVAFGVNSSAEKANNSKTDPAVQKKFPQMPMVISQSLKDNLLQWAALPSDSTGSLEKTLGTYLTPAEISQTRARLQEIVAHLHTANVKVIPSATQGVNPWSDDEVGSRMGFASTKSHQHPAESSRHGGVVSYLHTHQQQGATTNQQLDLKALLNAMQKAL